MKKFRVYLSKTPDNSPWEEDIEADSYEVGESGELDFFVDREEHSVITFPPQSWCRVIMISPLAPIKQDPPAPELYPDRGIKGYEKLDLTSLALVKDNSTIPVEDVGDDIPPATYTGQSPEEYVKEHHTSSKEDLKKALESFFGVLVGSSFFFLLTNHCSLIWQ